ncbi:unnamed protein product [Closterium sp. Naga37s-1]|nr:unnamed protein product [Closterium sp. Naga37s-1]
MRKCGAPKPAPGPSLMQPLPQYSVSPPRDPAAFPLVSLPSAFPAALHPRRSVFACPSPLAVCRPSTACSPSSSPPALPRPIVLSTPSIPLCVPALLSPLPSLPRQHAPSQAAAPMPGDPGAPMHGMHAMPPMQPLGAPYMPAMPPAHYTPYPPMPSPAPMYGATAMPSPYDPSAHLAPPYMPQAMPHMPMPPAHAFAPFPMDAYRPMPPPGMQQRQGEGADGRKRRGGPEGSGEGDWACTHSPHLLYLPFQPLPPTPCPICPAWERAGVQAAAPDGSWACSECGNVNYPFRSHCNRRHCGRPRPTHDTAAAASTGGGDAAAAVKQEVCPPGLRTRAIQEVM